MASGPPLEMKVPERKSVELIVVTRPDLNQFKPSHGNIFDLTTHPDSTSDLDDMPLVLQSTPPPNHQSDQNSLDEIEFNTSKKSLSTSSKKPLKSSYSSLARSKGGNASSTQSKLNPKNLKTSQAKSKKIKHNSSRPNKDESPDPDEDSNIDDLALSDYSEPETKLRDPEMRTESRRKFAKLRKARKQSRFKRLINREVHSRRIIPDSDDEIDPNAGQLNESITTEEDDDDSDSSSGSESGDSSETDEEERQRREQEFIVDDMATAAQKKRVKKQLQSHMPAKFRNVKQDPFSHFKTVCQYLLHHALLPQIEWREKRATFDLSCKHFDDFYNGLAMPMLETSAWILNFRNELNRRPYIRVLAIPQAKSGCQACNNRTKISRKIIQLTGQPYSPLTLNPPEAKKRVDESESSSGGDSSDYSSSVPEDTGKTHKFKLYNPALSNPSKPEFICGEDCANRALDYHYFKHWQLYLLRNMKEKLKTVNEDKAILQKQYKCTDDVPREDKLTLYKREIREIFEIIEHDRSLASLENLFQRTTNRLNRVHRKYKTVG